VTDSLLKKPKVLYLAASDWYFWCHRMPHALGAMRAGFDVAVATPRGEFSAKMQAAGLRHIEVQLNRKGRNPLEDSWTIAQLVRLYRRERPALVHHVAFKPILYGTLAAHIARVPAIVNALGGMGYVFLNRDLMARSVGFGIRQAFRLMLNSAHTRLILQNPDDVAAWTERGVSPARITLIRGAGVNTAKFAPTPEPDGVPVVVLPARLLLDKGVGEFVQAARILRARGVAVRMALVGEGDAANPKSLAPQMLAEWLREGIVEHWGWRDDMDQVYRDSHIACLPSYGEGLPKALLEAAASGRPLIGTDVQGVREIAQHGINALLVPAKNAEAIADAVQRLVGNQAERLTFGANGRQLVLAEFAEEHVVKQTVALYRELLHRQSDAAA
jgi:glycosyltransferase involved in cell wall biosynthesis